MSTIEQCTRDSVRPIPDALACDDPGDETVVVTRRGLVRIALVASEAAMRFQRDGVRQDPVAWMLAPRRLLAGRAPIDACLELSECERALMLHSLGIGLDADRAAFDRALMPMREAVFEEAA